MTKNYKLYFLFLKKGLAGIFKLTLKYVLKGIISLVLWIVNGIRQHRLRTAVIVSVMLFGLNVFQLVHYKVERLKVKQRCDSLYNKSLATKSYYDKGYEDGLRYNYKFQ